MKLPHAEVKFYPDVKSQTGLSSLRVPCKLALIKNLNNETLSTVFRARSLILLIT